MYDLAIIGAGIVGLATGLKLLERDPDLKLVIIEKEDRVAAHQTGHNSGVIHSGIYYRPGSLKARNCRRGYRQLLDFCDRQQVPYELCGKVIVAVDDSELAALETLRDQGRANGIQNLRLLDAQALREREPAARGVRALHVPAAGIVDFSLVAAACARILTESGAEIRLQTRVTGLAQSRRGCTLETTQGTISSRQVVNCGGLYADRIARLCGTDPEVRIIPFRGEYYTLVPASRHLVRNLIYPVPDPRFPFLGVHFTRRINGVVEAGPNAVLACAREGYRKADLDFTELGEILGHPAFWKLAGSYWKTGLGEMVRSYLKPAFVKALQKLVPDLTGQDLAPGGSGVRAQALYPGGRLCDDFIITRSGPVINVLNAPSPAATAALAIGEHIASLVRV